ncbi:hypothetical protein F511_05162 [Dorcoceras hygrometricum]|uniref:Uncharacterized protein n=1 Tax=Dorcoceras hygrometricum TaxID=472368 RepID=A0A2Z7C2H0_9LAMI|nr:hypothetical protein F511_05162 [Dorcoceras hygrometricum]
MVFVPDDFNVGSWDPGFDIVSALKWDEVVVFAMIYGDVAFECIVELVQVSFHPRGGTADYVVQRMPSCCVCVTEESLDQVAYHMSNVRVGV